MFSLRPPNVAFSRRRACLPGPERFNPSQHLLSKGRNASVTRRLHRLDITKKETTRICMLTIGKPSTHCHQKVSMYYSGIPAVRQAGIYTKITVSLRQSTKQEKLVEQERGLSVPEASRRCTERKSTNIQRLRANALRLGWSLSSCLPAIFVVGLFPFIKMLGLRATIVPNNSSQHLWRNMSSTNGVGSNILKVYPP